MEAAAPKASKVRARRLVRRALAELNELAGASVGLDDDGKPVLGSMQRQIHNTLNDVMAALGGRS